MTPLTAEQLATVRAAAADTTHHVRDEAALRRAYPLAPPDTSLAKVVDHIHPLYRPYIEASPFAVLATLGPRGLDTSPRGDAPGFVTVLDNKTLLLPDRRGNNRLDSLSNVLHDPRVALLFLIPGLEEAMRVNGTAEISTAPTLCEAFAVEGKPAGSVLVVAVNSVYFQCARALKRSGLWTGKHTRQRGDVPTIGTILQALSAGAIDGVAYEADLPTRQAGSLY